MKIYFNSSMPRSGSELLQVLLNQNPEIYGSTTSPLLEYQYGARSNFELPEVQSQDPTLMTNAFTSMCKAMANSYYFELTDKPIVVDKNRGWSFYWDWVNQWNPEPKMVCMVRDLRPMLFSMEKVYRNNRHRPIGPDNPAQLQGMTFEDRCDYWLKSQPIGLALQRMYESLARKLPILYLKYEDLVAKPQETLDTWYNFVILPNFEHNFENIQKEIYENSQLFGPYGNHNVKTKITEPDNSWKDAFTIRYNDYLKTTYQWYFETFNY